MKSISKTKNIDSNTVSYNKYIKYIKTNTIIMSDFYIVETTPNGNCLFESLAKAYNYINYNEISEKKTEEKTEDDIRKEIANYMESKNYNPIPEDLPIVLHNDVSYDPFKNYDDAKKWCDENQDYFKKNSTKHMGDFTVVKTFCDELETNREKEQPIFYIGDGKKNI